MTIAFKDFFRAVWGYEPYPWQSELSALVERAGWPRVLDLPTGSGKTAVLDIALHHLIVSGGKAPRRLIMVVDRRVVVDQVGDRARRILEALEGADARESSSDRVVLEQAREALASIVGSDAPLLHTEVLRGGQARADAWADYPHVPVLAGSTVDQVGSRLFFRGYGVSDRMKPIHAGLLGCDTLLFLDEVHLSRPFAEVLEQLQRLRGPDGADARRFGVVQLSATPGKPIATTRPEGKHGGTATVPAPFSLSDDDRRHAVLSRILSASKPARLEVVTVKARTPESGKRQAIAERAAERAREFVRTGRNVVAVVVNRVDTARRVWSLLDDPAFDRELVTGRMRPLDQAAVLQRIGGRVLADRDRETASRPLVLVATQCVEAGADYDFDAMVTECASLDALRQRFGRLARRGWVTPGTAPADGEPVAVILGRSDLLKGSDAVYGDALQNTWRWLESIATDGVVDFGIEALEPYLEALGGGVGELVVESPPAPVLLPAYLDQWVQTNPRPHADPDVSIFLHGIPPNPARVLPDVQVVWRADLEPDELEDPAAARALIRRLSAVPPGSLEMLSLPLHAVRQWLSSAADGGGDADIADVEGAAPGENGTPGEEASLKVLRWRGRESSDVVRLRDVVPGDVIVLPATYGGIGPHGTFDPTARGDAHLVPDLGDLVQLRQRWRPTLRLDERILGAEVGAVLRRIMPARDAEDSELPDAATVLDAIREVEASAVPWWTPEVLAAFTTAGDAAGAERDGWQPRPDVRLVSYRTLDDGAEPQRGAWLCVLRTPLHRRGGANHVSMGAPAVGRSLFGVTDGDGEDDESLTGAEVTLERHLCEVGKLAERYAHAVGLPEPLVASLRWAGALHDVGKADRRFQILLHGGDEIAARFGTPRAKSLSSWQDVAAREHARRKARYPEGQRHELVSLDMLEKSAALRERVEADGGDWDLVLHLVATHHGWCRPLAPVVRLAPEDGECVSFEMPGVSLSGTTAHRRDRLDSGVARRFRELVRRYGWHEVAYLEAILRLADHRQSAREVGA